MARAIVLPYTEEQNEPSAPYSKLLVLPDDELDPQAQAALQRVL